MLPIGIDAGGLANEDERWVSRLGRALTIRQCLDRLRGKVYFDCQIDLWLDGRGDGQMNAVVQPLPGRAKRGWEVGCNNLLALRDGRLEFASF